MHADARKMNVDQFYGCEIDERSAQIAKISLCLMDLLMDREFSQFNGFFTIESYLLPTRISTLGMHCGWNGRNG
jgi:hypothetical protein